MKTKLMWAGIMFWIIAASLIINYGSWQLLFGIWLALFANNIQSKINRMNGEG